METMKHYIIGEQKIAITGSPVPFQVAVENTGRGETWYLHFSQEKGQSKMGFMRLVLPSTVPNSDEVTEFPMSVALFDGKGNPLNKEDKPGGTFFSTAALSLEDKFPKVITVEGNHTFIRLINPPDFAEKADLNAELDALAANLVSRHAPHPRERSTSGLPSISMVARLAEAKAGVD